MKKKIIFLVTIVGILILLLFSYKSLNNDDNKYKTYESKRWGFSIRTPRNWRLLDSMLGPNFTIKSDPKTRSFSVFWVFVSKKELDYRKLPLRLPFEKKAFELKTVEKMEIAGFSTEIKARIANEKADCAEKGRLLAVETTIEKDNMYYYIVLQDCSRGIRNDEANIRVFKEVVATFEFLE